MPHFAANWLSDGVYIATANGTQSDYSSIFLNGQPGMIIDKRNHNSNGFHSPQAANFKLTHCRHILHNHGDYRK
jgi:hypothetical protein